MAGRIPPSFVDDLLSRVDLVDLIDSRVPLKKSGREFTACCPFHDEKSPSFTVSPSKQFYHCFGCGAHGTAIGFLMEYEHLGFVEAIEELAVRVGLPVPRDESLAAVRKDGPDLYVALQRAADFYRQQLRSNPSARRAVDYLKGRGLSGEIAAEFAVGYAPEGWSGLIDALSAEVGYPALVEAGLVIEKDGGGGYDRFRERVMFPIRDRRGRVIAFGGRILGDGKPKYLNSPETPLFHKGSELYGLFEVRQALRHIDRLVVVEGYMDVLALAQYGIRYAVATLGTATTERHLETLFRVCPEVVFCFDGDRAGREAAWKALQVALPQLRDGRQVRILLLPDGEDPDTLVRDEGGDAFAARLADARPVVEFFFDWIRQDVDLDSLDGRARLAALAQPHIQRVTPGVLRDLMLGRLAALTGLDSRRLGRDLRIDATAAAPRASRPRGAGPLSVMAKTMAMLIQRPDLAPRAESLRSIPPTSLAGLDLLFGLLDLLAARPNLTTGALIEHWRETEHFEALQRLAGHRFEVTESQWDDDFDGYLSILLGKYREARYSQLEQKARIGGLTLDEKREFFELSRYR